MRPKGKGELTYGPQRRPIRGHQLHRPHPESHCNKSRKQRKKRVKSNLNHLLPKKEQNIKESPSM